MQNYHISSVRHYFRDQDCAWKSLICTFLTIVGILSDWQYEGNCDCVPLLVTYGYNRQK